MEDLGLIPDLQGLEDPLKKGTAKKKKKEEEEGNSNPFQYFCLENPMDRGAWQATIHGVTKSQTQMTD